MSTLRDKLIRLGNKRRDLRNDISPVLQHLDSRNKKASRNWYEGGRRRGLTSSASGFQSRISLDEARQELANMSDREVLVRWALLRNEPFGEKDVEQFFNRAMGWKAKVPGDLRWEKGDRIEVKAEKCKDEVILPVIREVDGDRGTVEATHQQEAELDDGRWPSIRVDFDGGPTLTIPHGQRKKGSGLYTPKTGKGSMIEVVYDKIPDSRVTQEQKELAQQYMDRAMEDEIRSLNYHSGPAKSVKRKKDSPHDLYFGMLSQQRGGRWTSLNVVDGTVYYLGDMSNRPSGMRDDILRMIERKRR